MRSMFSEAPTIAMDSGRKSASTPARPSPADVDTPLPLASLEARGTLLAEGVEGFVRLFHRLDDAHMRGDQVQARAEVAPRGLVDGAFDHARNERRPCRKLLGEHPCLVHQLLVVVDPVDHTYPVCLICVYEISSE